WYVTGDDRSAAKDFAAASVEIAKGDPLTDSFDGVIPVLSAGAGDVGGAVAARARILGIPVNVMDDLQHSTFIMPAIVDRGDVVVAVGTGGASPGGGRRGRRSMQG